ncbi:hypothetical protein [Spirochaeta cellobiosiphila]|uniref:hypothetical protein n=1 Tax=Spirochaeta cellobiosiphila TaxID=504483 RepID=UPI000423A1E5|nr:hypothetical protein [Spirochaeta cellobiosiphila]
MSVSISSRPLSKAQNYLPRGRNVLDIIFEKRFTDFCDVYEDQYAQKYGKFHLDRIMDVGDYMNGVARIRCTKPECGHDYFVLSAVKGFIFAHPAVRKEQY